MFRSCEVNLRTSAAGCHSSLCNVLVYMWGSLHGVVTVPLEQL